MHTKQRCLVFVGIALLAGVMMLPVPCQAGFISTLQLEPEHNTQKADVLCTGEVESCRPAATVECDALVPDANRASVAPSEAFLETTPRV